MNKKKLIWENYKLQRKDHWPKEGRHILAQYDEHSVVVFQAFNHIIADYAVEHQSFGGTAYSFERMSWIKTNFLWMMYRCGWASKKNQERILAIRISREGFEDILSQAYTVEAQKMNKLQNKDLGVRLQWDPDHGPNGAPIKQLRDIQMGLRGQTLADFNNKYILAIMDITEEAQTQYAIFEKQGEDAIETPQERIYIPASLHTCRQIGLDVLNEKEKIKKESESSSNS